MLKTRKEEREKLLTIAIWLGVLLLSYMLAAWMIKTIYRILKHFAKD